MEMKIKLVLAFVFFVATAGCSKEASTPKFNQGVEKYEMVVFNTEEDIYNFVTDGFDLSVTKVTDGYKYIQKQELRAAAPVEVLTLYGHTSMTAEADKKGYFAEKAASALGIMPGYYVIAKELYQKKINISDNQLIIPGYQVDHSLCGYMPTARSKNKTRGYSVEQDGTEVTLTTIIIHIKNEIGTGYPTEVYSPLGYKAIDKLAWNVPYIKVGF